MKSIQEKKLTGSYRPDRDKTKGITVRGEVMTSVAVPKGLSTPIQKAWSDIVPYLCGLGIIYKQDIPTLEQAFTILEDIYQLEQVRGSPRSKKYIMYSELKLKYIRIYNDLMRSFFVSPKERLKAIAIFAQSQERQPSIVDKLLEK